MDKRQLQKLNNCFNMMVVVVSVLLVVALAITSEMSIHRLNLEIDSLRSCVDQKEETIDFLMDELYAKSPTDEVLGGVVSTQCVGEFKITAYCVEKREHICGTGTGITSSGQPVQSGVSAATGNLGRFPYGTVVYIEGVGIRIVQDTGGAVNEDQFDVAVDTHEDARRFGRQTRRVYVIKAVD